MESREQRPQRQIDRSDYSSAERNSRDAGKAERQNLYSLLPFTQKTLFESTHYTISVIMFTYGALTVHLKAQCHFLSSSTFMIKFDKGNIAL